MNHDIHDRKIEIWRTGSGNWLVGLRYCWFVLPADEDVPRYDEGEPKGYAAIHSGYTTTLWGARREARRHLDRPEKVPPTPTLVEVA